MEMDRVEGKPGIQNKLYTPHWKLVLIYSTLYIVEGFKYMHSHTQIIYIVIYFRNSRSRKRFVFFLSIYLFHSYIHVCFQLAAFAWEHI